MLAGDHGDFVSAAARHRHLLGGYWPGSRMVTCTLDE